MSAHRKVRRAPDAGGGGRILRLEMPERSSRAGPAGAGTALLPESAEPRASGGCGRTSGDEAAVVRRLAAALAHEVGNPLGAIIGYVELQRRGEELAGDWAEEIYREARRIDALIHRLLEYAAPSSGTPALVDVDGVARRCCSRLEGEDLLRGGAVDFRSGGDLPPVRFDELLLERVLQNLLLNAVDAVRPLKEEAWVGVSTECLALECTGGGPDEGKPTDLWRLLLRQLGPGNPLARCRRSRRYAIVSVADNGPGVPEPRLSRIFDPFYSTKPPGEGFGLGLSLASRLVERAGGTIEVENGPDGGAVFTVILPGAEPSGDPSARAAGFEA